MKKIRITEKQLAKIQERENDLAKKKVLKINEAQYNRLFKNGKPIIKENEEKGETKEIQPLEFAQELIVFIKDMITNAKTATLSPYWIDLDISKKELFGLIKKHGLLTKMVDETTGVNSYKAKKVGFRKGVKEIFNECKNKTLTEVGGFPMGAEDDPNAPMNQDDNGFTTKNATKVENPNLHDVHYNDRADDLMLFKGGDSLYAFIGGDTPSEAYEEFMSTDIVDRETIDNFVNALEQSKELQHTDDVHKIGEPYTLFKVTPEISQQLMSFYGDDIEMVNILNQIPETTTAASSGAYVGGANMNAPIKRAIGTTPGESMQDLNETGIDPTYTHFAIFRYNNKVADGWEFEGVDKDEVKYYMKLDLKDNFPDNKIGDFRLVTKRVLDREGFDYSDTSNWYKIGMDETTSMGGPSGLQDNGNSMTFDAPAGDGSKFWNAGNKMNKNMSESVRKGFSDNETPDLSGEFRTGFDLDEKTHLEQNYYAEVNQMNQSTSPQERDMLAKRVQGAAKKLGINMPDEVLGIGTKVMNQQGYVKESFHEPDGTPIPVDRDHQPLTRGTKVGQIYKNGAGRIRVDKILDANNILITKWGDEPSKSLRINPGQISGWELFMENKKTVLKLTEDQAKMVSEYSNDEGTRYLAEMYYHVWGHDDAEALKAAKEITNQVNRSHDNSARVTGLMRLPFGTIGGTPVNIGESVKKKALKKR